MPSSRKKLPIPREFFAAVKAGRRMIKSYHPNRVINKPTSVPVMIPTSGGSLALYLLPGSVRSSRRCGEATRSARTTRPRR